MSAGIAVCYEDVTLQTFLFLSVKDSIDVLSDHQGEWTLL